MRYPFIATLALLLLSGCALFKGNPAPVVTGCPAIRTYSLQEQIAQANAEAKLPPDSALISPLIEWGSLRAQLKPCQAQPNDSAVDPLPPAAAPVEPVKKSFFGTSL